MLWRDIIVGLVYTTLLIKLFIRWLHYPTAYQRD